MFKIQSPRINDFERLEEISKDCSFHLISKEISTLTKFLYSIQNFLPFKMQPVPSILLAVDDKKILGFIALQAMQKPNNCWQVNEIYVLDEVRNKGIGEELLRYALSVYGGQGIEFFVAEVDSQNFPALSLFHQCGFRRYAKTLIYEKEIEINNQFSSSTIHQENDLIIKTSSIADLIEVEKIELSIIPAELRPALGRSKNCFKGKRNSVVLVNKSRGIIIGWAQYDESEDGFFIEVLISPGWTHLYEEFLNTIIKDLLATKNNKCRLQIRSTDYIIELNDLLLNKGFLPGSIKEVLVKTVLQRVKERKTKPTSVGVPRIAPT